MPLSADSLGLPVNLFFLFILCSLSVFRLGELVAYDNGPFHVFKRLRTGFKGHPQWQELFSCYYCQNIHWSFWVSLFVWWRGWISLEWFPLWWWGLAGAAVALYRLIRERK